MTIKTLSRWLIGAGIVLMIYAMNMDVSVGSVVNIHKLSQQSNMLLLGGILFLAGIITLVTTRSRGGPVTDEQETVVSKDEMERFKMKAQQDIESAKDAANRFLSIFVARDETQRGYVIRIIGGVVAGVLAANIIHWTTIMALVSVRDALSDMVDGNALRLLYEYSEIAQLFGFTLVLWYGLRRQDKLIAFRNLFGSELAFYVLSLAIMFLFLEPKEKVLAELIICSLVCVTGLLVMAIVGQSKTQNSR